ncbi:p47 [Clostera anachoreta granulovirus]|uniref:p47 n=1 Tax=Clostera anachoreta granulovirus TaxID=283675 RepID=F4ZKT2_9BBAC|nr:p47 [Clostera anachoreta granulovirus]AEB00343.1 p47 [Clostera anachoreta granulovirus]
MHTSTESQCVNDGISTKSQKRAFVTTHHITSQPFSQCVKYLFSDLSAYWIHAMGLDDVNHFRRNECVTVKEGFVIYSCDLVTFDPECVKLSTPDDLSLFAECIGSPLIGLLLHDRWYKGDMVRLKRIILSSDKTRLEQFVTNCLWERGYEDNYTLGQQLSIRMTTNLIQSGLDFKHNMSQNTMLRGRGWSCVKFEKVLTSITSVADITKRYKCGLTYVVLELCRANAQHTLSLLRKNFTNVFTNTLWDNVCLIRDAVHSAEILKRLYQLFKLGCINLLFVTDSENYLHTHKLFYIYNSMKFYYYCLSNRFVFYANDYETLYLIHTVVMLEIINGGFLNSFTLEKSPMMHPLELNSRRCNALKRAALYNKTLCNDMELKVDFIKGKRITTGTHHPSRVVQIQL